MCSIRAGLLLQFHGAPSGCAPQARIALKTIDGLHTGKLRIALYYQDAGGHPLGSISKTMDLQLPEVSYQEYLKSGIPCSILIPTNAKDLSIKAVVYDMVGDKVGSRHMRVEKFWTP